MINYDSIFDQPKEEVEWASFKTVGERVAGTFIGLEEDLDGFNNPQLVVKLLRDGKRINYGVRLSHVWLVDQIKKYRLGQIIGFVFKETKPSPKGQPTKVIVPMASAGMIDDEWTKNWLESQTKIGRSTEEALKPIIDVSERLQTYRSNMMGVPVTNAPITATPVTPAAPVATTVAPAPSTSQVFDTIKNLAIARGVVPATATREEVEAKIKEMTQLDITDANVTQILVALTN